MAREAVRAASEGLRWYVTASLLLHLLLLLAYGWWSRGQRRRLILPAPITVSVIGPEATPAPIRPVRPPTPQPSAAPPRPSPRATAKPRPTPRPRPTRKKGRRRRKRPTPRPTPPLTAPTPPPYTKPTDESPTLRFDMPLKGKFARQSARGSIAVDDKTFQFAYYLDALRRKIAVTWTPPAGLLYPGQRVQAVVYFQVTRDGRVQAARIEQSSGLRRMDQSTLRAVVNAAPLPPLPYAFKGDRIGVHFTFELGG